MILTKHIHDFIQNDEEWLAWARIVSSYTIEDHIKFGQDHGMKHWIRVSDIAVDFARKAGCNDHYVNLIAIAGLLHDCGLICGEENHAENGANIARPYLMARSIELNTLNDSDIEDICHAIAHHSSGDDIRNFVDAAITFADKVDIARNRLVNGIHSDIQYCVNQIQRIDYAVSCTELSIYYTTDKDFDYHRFLTMWPKAYRVPAKVAAWLKRDFRFFINNQQIILPD